MALADSQQARHKSEVGPRCISRLTVNFATWRDFVGDLLGCSTFNISQRNHARQAPQSPGRPRSRRVFAARSTTPLVTN